MGPLNLLCLGKKFYPYLEPDKSYSHRAYPTLWPICPTLLWSFVLPYFRWKSQSDPCSSDCSNNNGSSDGSNSDCSNSDSSDGINSYSSDSSSSGNDLGIKMINPEVVSAHPLLLQVSEAQEEESQAGRCQGVDRFTRDLATD